jgi:GWxTD domain-containing protein
MILLQTWVHTAGAASLGWTLVHSLWQGALIGLALAAAFCGLRSARARYTAGCLAMLALMTAFCVTFQHVLAEQRIQGGFGQPLPIWAAPAGLGDGSIVAKVPPRFAAVEYLPWLAPFWIAGVLFFQLRGVASWMGARRLRGTGVCVARDLWQAHLDRLAARLRLSRPVTLLESCLADVPVVIGYMRPVILMPVGLMTGLPAGQIESILLHELAHIRRHDYLVNLLQIFVEGLMFYHPAVWWISGAIRAERENCCDDLAVATQGDAFVYATALAALEQNRGAVREAVLAANGGSLVKRVRRLLVPPEGSRAALAPVFSAAILTITAVAVLAAWQSTPPPRPPAPPVPSAPIAPIPPATPRPQAPSASGPMRLLAQVQETPAPVPPVDTPYSKWVKEDVAYIITDRERAAFKSLQSDPEREHFIEQFWQRRDPTPGTPENEFKEEHYRRIAYSNENFAAVIPGWKTDRGRIYIVYGPPDEKESHPAGGAYRRSAQEGGGTISTFPFEQWRYRFIEGLGTDIVVEFVDPARSGEYRMTMDPSEKNVLHVNGDWPPPGADTSKALLTMKVMFPKAFLSMKVLFKGAVQISLPLGAYGDHLVNVYTRVTSREGRIQVSDESVQGPAEAYTKVITLIKGSYRIEVVVKDTVTGIVATDTSGIGIPE